MERFHMNWSELSPLAQDVFVYSVSAIIVAIGATIILSYCIDMALSEINKRWS